MKKIYLAVLCAVLLTFVSIKAQSQDYTVTFTIGQNHLTSGNVFIPSPGKTIDFLVSVNANPIGTSLSGTLKLYVSVNGTVKELRHIANVSTDNYGSASFGPIYQYIGQSDINNTTGKLYVEYIPTSGISKKSREYTIAPGDPTSPTNPKLTTAQPEQLIAINKSGTPSTKTEMYIPGYVNGDRVARRVVTAFPETNADWEFKMIDYDNGGVIDLVGIKKNNTHSGVEIHVATSRTGYKELTHQRVTAFPPSATDWEFEITDYDNDGKLDLVGLKKANVWSGMEIHVARASLDFSQLTDQRVTAFPAGNDWEYEILDYDGDGKKDIVGIKKKNTSSGKIEIHVATGASNHSQLSHHAATGFTIDNNNWEYDIADYEKPKDGYFDLIGIKKSGTSTNTTEVHVADGSSHFEIIFGSTPTCFPQTDDTWEFCYFDSANRIAGGRKATSDSEEASLDQEKPLSVPGFDYYPNPAADMVNIDLGSSVIEGKKAVEIKLYRNSALVLQHTTVSAGKIQLPVKTLSPGLYHLHVQVGDTIINRPLVIIQ